MAMIGMTPQHCACGMTHVYSGADLEFPIMASVLLWSHVAEE